jgi:hypothetical protein
MKMNRVLWKFELGLLIFFHSSATSTGKGYYPPNTGRILLAYEREERLREENGKLR